MIEIAPLHTRSLLRGSLGYQSNSSRNTFKVAQECVTRADIEVETQSLIPCPSTPPICPASENNTTRFSGSSLSAFHLVQLPCGADLCPRPLSSHRQTHGVPPSSICTHVPQALDVVDDGAAQVVLNLHGGEMGVEVEQLLVVELADGGALVDVEAAHDELRNIGTDAVERLQRFFDEARFGEVGT